MRRLQELDISGNPITSILPLGDIQTLRILRVASIPQGKVLFSDENVNHVMEKLKLTILSLARNGLSQIPGWVANMTTYGVLDIVGVGASINSFYFDSNL